MKILPLQKEWEERKRLIKEGGKLRDEGWKLWKEAEVLWHKSFFLQHKDQSDMLWTAGDKLREEAHELWTAGDKLWEEAHELWNDAVERYYGKDVKARWRSWHEDNEPTCHVGEDTYV